MLVVNDVGAVGQRFLVVAVPAIDVGIVLRTADQDIVTRATV
jgi:hypothetical protein